MSVFEKIKEKFDCVYLLTLSNRKDRTESMFKQLKQIGMENMHDINIHYATPFPHNDIIAKAFVDSKRGRFSKPNEYDCARNHYSIVREAYDNPNCSKVLIIEDDIKFLKNEKKFIEYLDNIPKDFDILQFGGFTADPNIDNLINDSNNADKNWLMHPNIGIWNCSMYALSRKGIKYYLAYMDKFFWVADGPIYHAVSPANSKIVNTYISKIPIVIQADKSEVKSDIRNEFNDSINYESDNVYENCTHVDKNNDYFAY